MRRTMLGILDTILAVDARLNRQLVPLLVIAMLLLTVGL